MHKIAKIIAFTYNIYFCSDVLSSQVYHTSVCDVQEARTNYRNFRDLLWNLIFKKHWNDLEKARYVFI